MPKMEVVLQDFDGSRTICSVDVPLESVIHMAQKDMQVTVYKTYLRTDRQDENGRPICTERH